MTPPTPPRNQNRPKSYNVTLNPSGVRQATIALIVAQVHRHQSRHNCLPSTMEVANELEYHVTTVRKAWQQAIDTGQLFHSPPKCSASEEVKAKQAWGAENRRPPGGRPRGAGAVGHFDARRQPRKDEQDMNFSSYGSSITWRALVGPSAHYFPWPAMPTAVESAYNAWHCISRHYGRRQ